MSIIGIRTVIETKINAIKTAAGIAVVHDYEPITVTTTPAVAIVYNGGSEEDSTNSQNTLISNFTVRVMKEVEGDDDTAVTSILTIADAIMTELRKDSNRTLSSQSYNVQIAEITPVFVDQKENMRLFVIDIKVQVKSFETVV